MSTCEQLELADTRLRVAGGRGETAGNPAWAGVVSLSLGIFAIVMSEFLPASLLPRVAEDLRVSAGAAGQAVSVTAFAAALAALVISVVLPRADRRHVMIVLTVLAAVSDLIVAIAPNLYVLLAARLLLGVALGGFWAMAAAMAAHLVPTDHVGRALTVINSGVSGATVAAVPLGAWLGGVWGWRGVFLLGAGVAVLAVIAQAATLPNVTPAAAGGLRALGSVLRSSIVLVGLFAILLIFGGHFSGFTYIRTAVQDLSGIDDAGFAVLLLVFGVASFLGTVLSGPLADRAPLVGVFLFPAALGVGMLVMRLTGGSVVGLFIAAAVWGLAFGGVPTTILSWGARTEPARLEQIGGAIVTVCNIGIAVGATVGGVLVDGVSASTPLLVGGVASIGGAAVLVTARRRRQR
ncbi:MFS transporter, DHA1 family, purine ribonucleoside efflux pump [Frankia canadensis]|uniref:MFS transporter, DHA1 family, purine ribonucleoside efflux pump n=1 Tax=Frankia canadensis TaxID=1836972 RepID=A0A2I2KPL8_9ACTN|nr:MFS transporter [Frankia canadensis]SNQ47617.1 MFS transporter, DHA1 family, purine ribonucleoside efflux pump [Frankia canadensis]SOU54907.1 MFS transporter, DHA1 family, purine ribonucleoside efflux pump [Frankia canadensis]